MPWQRAWADVVYEIDPETGQLAYREDRVGTPRQSGKTSWVLPRMLHRALACGGRDLPFGVRPQNIRYGAQTGSDARKKWQDDWLPVLRQSRFSAFYRERLANGHEALLFANGSKQDLLAGTETSGHGGTVNMGLMDEVFAHKDARHEQSLLPAMITIPQPQLGLTSTAGTPKDSPYWYAKVLHGRRLAQEQATDVSKRRGIAYLEYGFAEGADPVDPRTWWAGMPALGYTVTEDAVRSALETMLADPKLGLNEFLRAYGNQWVLTMGDPIIPLDHWQSLSHPEAPKPPWVMLGLSVAPEDGSAALVACGEDLTGLQSMVVEHGTGVDWLFPSEADPVGALGRQIDRFTTPSEGRPFVVVAEKSVAHLVSELERVVGFDRLIVRKQAQLPAVCAFWLRACKSSLLTHCGEPELQVALAGAERRFVGGAWVWDHARSGADVTPLEAQGLAASGFMGHWGEDIGE